ncbi:MAG TPA: maltose/maltodextrin ABC transporter substrate-binding protein MalE [Chthoniobacterales bacterium]
MHQVLKAWLLLAVTLLGLWPLNLKAWTNGQLVIWMDSGLAQGLRPIAAKFKHDWGIEVTTDTPANIISDFQLSAEAGKGPDIVLWAHDKVGEWADSGLVSPVRPSSELLRSVYPRAWEAVQHRDSIWGYPLALETVTLIYNKKLVVGRPPTDLSQLISLNRLIQARHPGVRTILWDYASPYYSWGILASAGGYVFKKRGTDYDLKDVGVASPGAIEGLSGILTLVRGGILPLGLVNGQGVQLMAEGKVAMTISGPWDWPSLTANQIDFGLAPMPGIDGSPGRPFIGVTVAYLNQASPNKDLARQFLEQYLLTDNGLLAMNRIRPIGVPALISSYEKLAKDDLRVRQLKQALDEGEIMPNVPQMGLFFDAVGSAMQIAADGRASAAEALRDAAAQMLGKQTATPSPPLRKAENNH